MCAQRPNQDALHLDLWPTARGVTEPTGHHISHVARTPTAEMPKKSIGNVTPDST